MYRAQTLAMMAVAVLVAGGIEAHLRNALARSALGVVAAARAEGALRGVATRGDREQEQERELRSQ